MKENKIVIFKLKRNVGYINFKNSVSDDILRPVLQGSGIDPIGGKLVCTDATILTMYPIEVLENKSNIEQIACCPLFIFDRRHYYRFSSTRSVFNMVDFTYVIDYTKECVKVYPPATNIENIHQEECMLKVDFIQGRFPNYKAVLPNVGSEQALHDIGINLDRISDIVKSVKEQGNKDDPKFKLLFFGKNRAILGKELNNSHPIEFILMPISQ